MVDIFQRISKELAGDVPLKVINDGEVGQGRFRMQISFYAGRVLRKPGTTLGREVQTASAKKQKMWVELVNLDIGTCTPDVLF